MWFDGDGWGVHIHEEIPVPAEGDREQKAAVMMQQVARLFEAGIRAHPQDWHMLQKVFVADLDPARLAAARARPVPGPVRAGHEGRPGLPLQLGHARHCPGSPAGPRGARSENFLVIRRRRPADATDRMGLEFA